MQELSEEFFINEEGALVLFMLPRFNKDIYANVISVSDSGFNAIYLSKSNDN